MLGTIGHPERPNDRHPLDLRYKAAKTHAASRVMVLLERALSDGAILHGCAGVAAGNLPAPALIVLADHEEEH
jgi:hypothetical protein